MKTALILFVAALGAFGPMARAEDQSAPGPSSLGNLHLQMPGINQDTVAGYNGGTQDSVFVRPNAGAWNMVVKLCPADEVYDSITSKCEKPILRGSGRYQ